MGKVGHPRRSHSVYRHGSQYPYSTCHASSGLAQQARRPPPYNHGTNGLPRLSAAIAGRNGMDNFLHSLSERLRTSSTRLSRTASLSTSSSSSQSSPNSSTASHQLMCMDDEKPLKRLAFVRAQGSFWLTWISAAYSTGRSMVPLPRGIVNALENTMSDLGGNLVTAATQQGEKVLYALDAKVDSLCEMASTMRDGSAGEVWWESLVQRPPFKYACQAYQQAHDVVIATPLYNKALEIGGETMSRVHDSRLYKSLLPLVGPLTEPAVKRIIESPTFQAIKEHLTPMPAPETEVPQQMQPLSLVASAV